MERRRTEDARGAAGARPHGVDDIAFWHDSRGGRSIADIKRPQITAFVTAGGAKGGTGTANPNSEKARLLHDRCITAVAIRCLIA